LRHFRQAEQNQPTRKKQPRQFVPQEATLEQLTARLSTATTLAEKTQARHGLEQRRDLLAKRLAVAGSPTERLSSTKADCSDTISGNTDRFQAIPLRVCFASGKLRCLTPSKSLPL